MRRPPRGDVRRRLLTAALKLFSEQGYDGTSLEQVAAAAGFSKGAVYSNFASKDDLFLALMDAKVQARINQARDVLTAPHDPAESAQLVGRRLTAALTDDRDWQLLFLDYVGRAVRDPAVRVQFVAHRRRVRQLIAEAARDLLGGNEAALDANALATIILALSNGLAIERLTDPDAVPGDLLGRVLENLITPSEPVT
jgi:AcrR family transcriptional regulator